jgi:septal ring factor EnvC (AmiA/AmiB activator)
MNQAYEDPDLYFLRGKPFLGYECPAWLRVSDGRCKEVSSSHNWRPEDEIWADAHHEQKKATALAKVEAREAKRAETRERLRLEKVARLAQQARLREEASQRLQAQHEAHRAEKEAKKLAKATAKAKPELTPYKPAVIPAPRQAEERREYWRNYAREKRQKGTGTLGQTFAVELVYMWPDGRLQHFPSKLALSKALGKSPSVVARALDKNFGMFDDGGIVRVKQ